LLLSEKVRLRPRKGHRPQEVAVERKLKGKRVAILVEDGFEQVELTEPRAALEEAGARAEIVSPVSGKVKGWNHTKWGQEFSVDRSLEQAHPDDYDALLLPGGVMNPDKLRRNEKALGFVRAFFKAGKPVAAICHAPWTLIDAGVAFGRRLTSFESIQSDLKNAGARWVDQEVVVDNGLVTSRKPSDISAFNAKMIEEFAEGRHVSQRHAG
jgi:protease I